MMVRAKCYDVVETVTNEATKQFGSVLAEDKNKKHRLKEICDLIDEIASRSDGISYEVKIDDNTTDITISLVCGEFEVSSGSEEFDKVICQTKRIEFRQCNEEQLQMDFTFGGIWVRVG